MIKLTKYIFLFFIISHLCAISVNAQMKVDAGKIVQKGSDFAQEIQTKIEDVQKEVAKKTELATKAKGDIEGKGLVADIRKTANDAKAKAAEAKDKAQEKAEEAQDKAQEKAGEAQDKAQNKANNSDNNNDGNISETQQKTIVALQTKQKSELQYIKDQVQEVKEDCAAKEKVYQDNIMVYEAQKQEDASLQKNIDELNQQMEKDQAECQEKVEDLEKLWEEINKSYEEKIEAVKKEASQKDPSQTDSTNPNSQLNTLMGGAAGAELNQVLARNFYAQDEASSPKKDGEIDTYRRLVELNDSADVYYQSVQIMAGGDDTVDIAYDLKNTAQATETTPAAVMLGISINVEQMNSLLKFARLLVAEMKQTTARDMVKLDRHLNNYEKDMTTMQLDSYKEAGEKKK